MLSKLCALAAAVGIAFSQTALPGSTIPGGSIPGGSSLPGSTVPGGSSPAGSSPAGSSPAGSSPGGSSLPTTTGGGVTAVMFAVDNLIITNTTSAVWAFPVNMCVVRDLVNGRYAKYTCDGTGTTVTKTTFTDKNCATTALTTEVWMSNSSSTVGAVKSYSCSGESAPVQLNLYAKTNCTGANTTAYGVNSICYVDTGASRSYRSVCNTAQTAVVFSSHYGTTCSNSSNTAPLTFGSCYSTNSIPGWTTAYYLKVNSAGTSCATTTTTSTSSGSTSSGGTTTSTKSGGGGSSAATRISTIYAIFLTISIAILALVF